MFFVYSRVSYLTYVPLQISCRLPLTTFVILPNKKNITTVFACSGVFGGTVNEGMADLIWMMDQLVDDRGNILITGHSNYFFLSI